MQHCLSKRHSIQSLNTSLKEEASTGCKDNYLRLMAYLLESYLDTPKLLFLREHLAEIIARQTQDDYAAHYFKQRFAKAELHELLKHHHKLTGRWLILTYVDYDHHKFKIKQVGEPTANGQKITLRVVRFVPDENERNPYKSGLLGQPR